MLMLHFPKQIVFFFGLALGVANNRSLPKFTRFNAQQAILLDIIQVTICYVWISPLLGMPGVTAEHLPKTLQILPEVVLGKGPPPGDDFLLQATILASNTVFLYVYLCCVAGVSCHIVSCRVSLHQQSK